MPESFKLELVSPEKLILSEDVEMVVLPGGEGDFGVLCGHSPVISTLRPGTISVFEGGAVKLRIFVSAGFAEVNSEGCTVLAEEAENVEDLDRAAIEKMLADASDDLRSAEDARARQNAAGQVAVAEAKLGAIDSPAYS
jgi:F-type H+-transporting ATPase subunit epsilon